MNTNQLRYFATIAQLNNLSKAAEILGVTQSSLSKSINNLEEELGVQLFDRSGKKITLNAEGERFLECVDSIYDNLISANNDIQKMKGSEKAYIRISASGCFNEIIDCVAQFKKKHPKSEFNFFFSIENSDNLNMKNFDVAIYPDESKYASLGGTRIGSERYFLAVSSHHPLAGNPVISTKALEGQDMIYLRSSVKPEFAYHFFKSLDIKFNSISYADTRQAQIQIISSGIAIGIIPESIRKNINENDITLIPFINKNLSRNMMMCFRKDKHLSPIALEFKSAITEYFENKDKNKRI